MAEDVSPTRKHLGLTSLICLHAAVCCVSLVCVARFNYPGFFDPAMFHMFYDPSRLSSAVPIVAAFALIAFLFGFARFSFGYFVGFYFYTMVLGYLWLNCFSDLNYNHQFGALSAAISAIAFLAPALLITAPIKQQFALPERWVDLLLALILVLGLATVAAGAFHNFRFVALANIYGYRDKLEFPAGLRYSIGIVSNTLLPFAFACFVVRGERWHAGAVLLLLLLFYPITLSKISLFTPFWLVAMVALSRLFETRIAVILSLLVPILAGVILLMLFRQQAALYFATINFRMIAIPASVLDIYSDFFSRHDVTHFCQLSFLNRIVDCPYREPLSTVLKDAYRLGDLNGSLFATEGVASVGLLWAPVAVFVCGLVIALGNRLSAGLPPSFILISGAVLPQVLINVRLSTVLLTHGAGLLFLLWKLTPRTMFEPKTAGQTVPAAGWLVRDVQAIGSVRYPG